MHTHTHPKETFMPQKILIKGIIPNRPWKMLFITLIELPVSSFDVKHLSHKGNEGRPVFPFKSLK